MLLELPGADAPLRRRLALARIPLPWAKTPPTSPRAPPLVLPELPAPDDPKRHRLVPELNATADAAGLRDRAPIEPPAPHGPSAHAQARRRRLGAGRCRGGRRRSICRPLMPRSATDPCSPWMPPPPPQTPPPVLPELPAAYAPQRHRPMRELDAAGDVVCHSTPLQCSPTNGSRACAQLRNSHPFRGCIPCGPNLWKSLSTLFPATTSEVASAARQVADAKFICWPSSIRDDQQTTSFIYRRECSLCKLCKRR